jgi:hypothetical protein
MPRNSARLPKRFPIGSTYVLESRGSMKGMTLIHRYVRFPDGRQVELAARLVPSYEPMQRGNVPRPVPARTRARRQRVEA